MFQTPSSTVVNNLPIFLFVPLSENMPCVRPEHPLSPLFLLVHSLPHLLLFFYFSLFAFLICFPYFLLSSPSLSARIVPLCFHARGCRKRPNVGVVCCAYFVLLWSPYVIGQTVIFLPCGFICLLLFFSSPNLSGRRLDVYHTSSHGVALV